MNTYILQISGGIGDTSWCADVREETDAAAIEYAETRILARCRMAAEALRAVLWLNDKPVQRWNIRRETVFARSEY